MLLFPWGIFWRGVLFGVVGGAAIILLFLLMEKQHIGPISLRPIYFVYFIMGVELGVAVIGAFAYIGLHALGIRIIRWQP